MRRLAWANPTPASPSLMPTAVALAAIQGLNQNLEATRKELGRRDAENAELKVRLEKLERRLAEKLPRGARWNARSPSHQ